MKFIKHLLGLVYREYIFSDSERTIKYWRKRGILIGKGCVVPNPKSVKMEDSRTCLIKIGDNVRLNFGLTIMAHDYASVVFIRKYGELINSSGHIIIGNNIYFGRNCTVLKGVSIGDNCIIGYGSVVMKDIPANSVAVGCPAKVICSIEDYFSKRKSKALNEAFEYAKAIKERYNRKPIPKDFNEEFPYFIDKDNIADFPDVPVETQMLERYEFWLEKHKRSFNSFDDFLNAAGIK